MMKMSRRMTALALAAMMTVAAPAAAFAATVPEGYDAETWTRLQDNILEYDEIWNLVKEYNPQMKMMMTGIEGAASTSNKVAADMRDYAETWHYLYKEAQDAGDDANAKGFYEEYRKAKKSADRIEKSLSSRTRSTVNQTQKKLTSAVQGLMIDYQQSLAAREMLQTRVELSQAAYDLQKTQLSQGMTTETEVQAAEKSLLEAQAGQKQVEDGINTMRQNLCMMTGWSYDASPEIGAIPEPDLTRIAAMDPAADFTKARGNNYALISLRSGTSKGTTRERAVDEAEALLKTNLENLYLEVIQNQTAYTAASTAYQAAQITMNGVDTKYQMGMLGRPEYLMQKMAYQQQKMTYVQASLALTQAMETYDWAVEGLAEIQ